MLSVTKVRQHYLHHDYAFEKREAWRLLSQKVSEIFQPRVAPNIVPLNSTAVA